MLVVGQYPRDGDPGGGEERDGGFLGLITQDLAVSQPKMIGRLATSGATWCCCATGRN